MKKLNFLLSATISALMALTVTACSDNDDPKPSPEPVNPTPSPEPTPEIKSTCHFDLFLTVGKHGGMSSSNNTIVATVKSLTADQGLIKIDGVGTELGDYSIESISKGKYYYQVPYSGDRFTKYEIKDNKINIIKEQQFVKNTFKIRSYSHTWLDDNTILFVSATGDTKKVIWTKVNSNDMSIVDEGELAIAIPDGYSNLTTTGILAYREADKKLFYFYYGKTGTKPGAKKELNFHTAVINPETMEIEKDSQSPMEAEMAGSSYGELMQNTVMFDETGNLYIAAFQNTDIEKGMLLRIKAGETEIDKDYNGYPDSDGKLLTIQYLGNNKAFVYARNDKAPISETAKASGIKKSNSIDAFSHYYAIIDIATGTKSDMEYEGKKLGYSGGRFAQRSVIMDGKLYFATCTEGDENSVVYIYDIATGKTEKGAEVEGKHFFDMIRAIED